jgi:hypothetical protein
MHTVAVGLIASALRLGGGGLAKRSKQTNASAATASSGETSTLNVQRPTFNCLSSR